MAKPSRLSGWAALFSGALLVTASMNIAAFQRGYDTITSTGSVHRVIDADTFIINLNGAAAYNQLAEAAQNDPQRLRHFNDTYQSIRVRLANIDTPESVHPDASRNTEEGRLLSQQVKVMLEGQATSVGCWDWGDFGRAICSITLPNGDDLGHWLIENGHSDYVTRWGRHPYLDSEYQAAQD